MKQRTHNILICYYEVKWNTSATYNQSRLPEEFVASTCIVQVDLWLLDTANLHSLEPPNPNLHAASVHLLLRPHPLLECCLKNECLCRWLFIHIQSCSIILTFIKDKILKKPFYTQVIHVCSWTVVVGKIIVQIYKIP